MAARANRISNGQQGGGNQNRGRQSANSSQQFDRGWNNRDSREGRPQNPGSWGPAGREENFPPNRSGSDRGDWDNRGEGRSFNQSDQGYPQRRSSSAQQGDRSFESQGQDDRYGSQRSFREAGGYQNEDDSERYYSGRGQRSGGNEASTARPASASRGASSRNRSQSRSRK